MRRALSTPLILAIAVAVAPSARVELPCAGAAVSVAAPSAILLLRKGWGTLKSGAALGQRTRSSTMVLTVPSMYITAMPVCGSQKRVRFVLEFFRWVFYLVFGDGWALMLFGGFLLTSCVVFFAGCVLGL